MKLTLKPNQLADNLFEVLQKSRTPIDGSFIPEIDTLDISILNGKKFVVAIGAGDANKPDVIGNSIKEDLTLEEALTEAYSLRNERYCFPKIFMIDGEDAYLLDPFSTAALSSDPQYYGNSIGGSLFKEDVCLPVPSFFKIEEKPKDDVNTLVVSNSGYKVIKPGEKREYP